MANIKPAIERDFIYHAIAGRLQDDFWRIQIIAQSVSQQHLPEVDAMTGLAVFIGANRHRQAQELIHNICPN